MLLDILITLFLVFLNGFFVAAEFAIVKVRASQLETEGDGSKARTARTIVRRLDAYLSATQLGITLASLGLGFVGEELVAQLLIDLFHALKLNWGPELAHNVALPIAFALITVMHIVFGELAPKSLAIRFPLPVTLWVALPMRAFYVIFRPFIWLLNTIATAVLRLFGIQPMDEAHGESHSEDELRYLVAESQRRGAINASEGELIERVFDFDERIVKQVMVPRTAIYAADMEDGPEAVMEVALEGRYTRVPVYRGTIDDIIGLLYVKDLVRLVREGREREVETILRPVIFVPPTKHVAALLREMQTERYHMAVVTDEFGGTVGLITIEDLVEELVGHIYDELEAISAEPQPSASNEYVVSAQTSIIDLNEFLPEELPESREYSTLAGLILTLLRRLPRPGESLRFGSYEITVLAMAHNRIETTSLRYIPETEAGSPHDDLLPEAD